MKAVFGLDGGGSTTRLRIADPENAEIWQGRGEGINPNANSPETIANRLEALFSKAYEATGLDPKAFASGCLGVAGAGRAEEQREIESILRDRLRLDCRLEVLADPDIALVGALKRLEGLILIAGTGSIAIARLSDGTRFRSGGLGHYLGDEGSAFFIGFEAIRRSLRALEGRDQPTAMLPELLGRFSLDDPSQFIGLIYRRFDKAAIASCADIVESQRAALDPLAVAIMDEARGELLSLVASIASATGGRIADPAIALWGGLIEHNPWLREGLKADIRASFPDLAVVEPIESAVYGACMLAIELGKTG